MGGFGEGEVSSQLLASDNLLFVFLFGTYQG
jgi:hypothetical protein